MRKRLRSAPRSRFSELAEHPDVIKHYPVLAQAAAHIAGPTHRNMGTVGGNLCLDTRCIFYNQSEWWRSANNHCLKTTGTICHVAPKSRGVCFATFSGDLAPALLALGAEVDIAGPDGKRTIPLEQLYIGFARQDVPVTETQGDGKFYLSLRPGEIVIAVRAKNTPGLRSAYDKIRIRRSIEYPVAGVAVALKRDGDTLTDLRVAFTGTNPRPVLLAGTAELVRRRPRRTRDQGPRRAGARPDHADEDHLHARPLPPPRRRRIGAAAGHAIVRRLTGGGHVRRFQRAPALQRGKRFRRRPYQARARRQDCLHRSRPLTDLWRLAGAQLSASPMRCASSASGKKSASRCCCTTRSIIRWRSGARSARAAFRSRSIRSSMSRNTPISSPTAAPRRWSPLRRWRRRSGRCLSGCRICAR